MKLGSDGTLRLYASDLQRFSVCQHATHLDLRKARGENLETAPDSEDAKLLGHLGNEHEQQYLLFLQQAGKTVVSIERGPHAFDQTVEAIKSGIDVVYQGALQGQNWYGYVDFLERIDTPSDLGNFSYEVVDTKLKRVPSPKHILQLVIYSDLLADVQGLQPEYGHLQLGQGHRSSHRLAECADYVHRIRDRLNLFVDYPDETIPRRCSDCDLCRWRVRCNDQWDKEDSLYLVAGIREQQIVRLEKAGITSMASLADLEKEDTIHKISPSTLQNLRIQAQLQTTRKKGGPPKIMLRPHISGKGFDLLPEPADGDLFYDIEGNPHYRENGEEGLEYLHGIWYLNQFKAFWAHNHSEEHQALRDLFHFFEMHLEKFPHAHIYHYAPYEMTALRRLTTKYSFGEETLDGWQREKRFVDLYAVVRGGIYVSEKNYSLKSLEIFYMDQARTGSVTTATASVVAYNLWREKWEAGDPSAIDDLKELEHYNMVDCESTEKLRDWLLPMRSQLHDSQPAQLGAPETKHSTQQSIENEELKDLIRHSNLSPRLKKLLIDLGLFHYREKKPPAWAVFDASKKSSEELLDDTECLAGLKATGKPYSIHRSVERSYSFPPQFTKLTNNKSACIAMVDGTIKTVTISDFSSKNARLKLRIGNKSGDSLYDTLDLLPPFSISTTVIERAIRNLIQLICAHQAPQASIDLLERNRPNLETVSVLVEPKMSIIDRMEQAVSGMQSTVLMVQGPPGTGKTYVSARAILSLVQQGYRIAVSSNSHEAIRNLLVGCHRASSEFPQKPIIAHKVSTQSKNSDRTPYHLVTSNDDVMLFKSDIVGGTAWLFSRPEMIREFDYLFVDEAGQVSLANLFGMSLCTQNIVMIGDPCQLPQVIQASHPEPANLSCLEWMLGSNRLVKSGEGIFLEETWRMHPKLCTYISEQFYEGRLHAHPDTANQSIFASPLPKAGAYLVPVDHQELHMQECEEEGIAIHSIIDNLLTGSWMDRHRVKRTIEPKDIIVVAPFNAQVNMLRDMLPDSVRVGTVDKFQGQEAAIALVSMTSSSTEEAPRGMDFLLSRERINVALSRGKALSLVFASPRLLTSSCKTAHQIRLVNALCALETLNLEF